MHTIETRTLSLAIETADGLNPGRLATRDTGWVIAGPDYHYAFGRPRQVEVRSTRDADGIATTALTGTTRGGLTVTHNFAYRNDGDWIDEWIEITNTTSSPIEFKDPFDDDEARGGIALRAGFVLQHELAAQGKDATPMTWRAVPFLRSTETGESQAYQPEQIVRQPSGRCASEGWVLSRGDENLLVLKYNPCALEMSVLSASHAGDAQSEVVFGGAGIFRGDPEAARTLPPGETLRLGTTRYQYVEGDWPQGFYAFRAYMDARGHRFVPGYDPPVHWNVIYDNPQWWHPPDNEASRAKHYRREHLIAEAEKAREIGCEALYLDPGWDTHFGSTQWDQDRLGSAEDFVHEMRESFGLSVSLHTPLANWNIDKTYPTSAWLRDATGEPARLSTWEGFEHGLCSAAPGWWNAKRDRLIQLADAGFRFFMFDGTNYTPCHDPAHSHHVPLTREEHSRGYAELARVVRQHCPDVRIEMHDPICGPAEQRYAPMYYTHGPDTFETIWGFEYMWYSMQDLLQGKALALYYYNLAYNLPLYLHVNLKTDNPHALMFWWYASTCRHLGFGGRDAVASTTDLPEIGVGAGYTPDPVRWAAHCAAMKQYRRNKAFYTHGAFFGIDETTHVHSLPEKNAAVVNCFNLTDQPHERTIRFTPEAFGLRNTSGFQANGAADWVWDGRELVFTVRLPAHGACVVEVSSDCPAHGDCDKNPGRSRREVVS
ncbi:MAG: hypothetical protein ACIAXF_09645 [Phycisphaerales bacterium JB063]